MWFELVQALSLGALAGAGASLTKYLKKLATDSTEFKWKEFSKTVWFGLAIGGVGAFYGVNFLSAEAIILTSGAALLLQAGFNAVWIWSQRLYTKLKVKFSKEA